MELATGDGIGCTVHVIDRGASRESTVGYQRIADRTETGTSAVRPFRLHNYTSEGEYPAAPCRRGNTNVADFVASVRVIPACTIRIGDCLTQLVAARYGQS